MIQKTCFVISPIGGQDTDIRKHADDFLELLIEPALTKFNFRVIRADKISRASIITNDIIEFVQQADLCVVDLTFHNPNVFYECGRRHETGRPTIQLIKKGDKLPFDVAGIRTIEYDLSNPRTTLESVKCVQKFIEEIESLGNYSAQSSGVSLTTIAETLSRIERKISSVGYAPVAGMNRKIPPKDLITKFPGEAFKEAMDVADIESAKFLLPRIKKFMGDESYIVALATLAEAADEESKSELLALIKKLAEEKNYDCLNIALNGLVDFYNTTGAWKIGISEIQEQIYDISNDSKHPSDVRALTLNHLQKLRYLVEQYEEALVDALRIVELAPNDESYLYNLSLIYKELNRNSDAADVIIKFIECSREYPEKYLSHIEDIVKNSGRKQEIELALSQKRNAKYK